MYLRTILQASNLARKHFIRSSAKFDYIHPFTTNCQSTKTELNMAEKASGKYLSQILEKLEQFGPLSLAESWDNVGLLVDPLVNTLIQNILLTNDLTEDIMEEAIKLNAGLIVTYHPNIFQGMKSVTGRYICIIKGIILSVL